MHKIPSKFYVLPLLLIAICTITMVCASFSEEMMITGDAYVRVDKDIRITDIKMVNPTHGAFEPYNAEFSTDLTAIYATLPSIESTITYEVTVENKTDDIYIVSSVTNDFNNENIVYDEDAIVGQVIPAKSSAVLTVTLKYNTDTLPENTTQSGTINYKFEIPSATAIQYSNSNYTSCTNVQCAIDELYDLYNKATGEDNE